MPPSDLLPLIQEALADWIGTWICRLLWPVVGPIVSQIFSLTFPIDAMELMKP